MVAWYLDKIQDQIESEEDLIERKSLIEKIIDRLTYYDEIIIPLRSNQQGDHIEDEEGPMLIAHPNYVIE